MRAQGHRKSTQPHHQAVRDIGQLAVEQITEVAADQTSQQRDHTAEGAIGKRHGRRGGVPVIGHDRKERRCATRTDRHEQHQQRQVPAGRARDVPQVVQHAADSGMYHRRTLM